jgi:NADH:ubiquinone oxidoreductase subunit F (NADH-binding)
MPTATTEAPTDATHAPSDAPTDAAAITATEPWTAASTQANTGTGTSIGAGTVVGDGATLLASWRARGDAALSAHLAHHGPPPLPGPGDTSWPERFAATLDASGLTGRGGAAFPSSTKLRLVRSARGCPTLVVNAMEGEPASDKDRVLLSCVPHLVLDGAQLAACALNAARVVVAVADDRHDTARALMRAVAEREAATLAPVPIQVLRPPGRFVAGEESALVSWLSGGPGAPGWRPDKSIPLSIGRGAALVHNAETLAHMALVARYGPAAFRAAGLVDAPGTTLVTISGAVEHTGVYEVAMGTTLGEVVRRARPKSEVAAVLTGGFGGSWVPASALSTPYAPRPMAAVGGVVGAGVLVVLTSRACGIAETARVVRYMAGESAGQCGPCVFGLPAIADDLERLAVGTAEPDALRRLESRVASVDGRGACRHPDGVARMVRSALAVFAADAAAHAAGRPCPFRGEPSVLPTTRPATLVATMTGRS